jgi:hypothetical protein
LAHNVVKIIYDEDGAKRDSPKWHLVVSHGDAPRTACTGEVFGEGEGAAIYKKKTVTKGGVTCPHCLQIIKWYKSITL